MKPQVHTAGLVGRNGQGVDSSTLDDRAMMKANHDQWVTACSQLRAAYLRWTEAPLHAWSERYAVFVAMFDQEAAAASAYGRAVTALSGSTDR